MRAIRQAHGTDMADYHAVRRGPEDATCDMLAGKGWIMPRADAERLGLIQPDPQRFVVRSWPDWSMVDAAESEFATEAAARAYCATLAAPIIDLVDRHADYPLIAVRRMLRHPAQEPAAFSPRDDFPTLTEAEARYAYGDR
jgi:hypothetical protein